MSKSGRKVKNRGNRENAGLESLINAAQADNKKETLKIDDQSEIKGALKTGKKLSSGHEIPIRAKKAADIPRLK